jgi:hypothetical protein
MRNAPVWNGTPKEQGSLAGSLMVLLEFGMLVKPKWNDPASPATA